MIWRTSGTSSRAAADHHHPAIDAVRPKGIDDIGKAVGQSAQSGHEQPLHRADVRSIEIQIESGNDRTRIGIGKW